MVDSKSSDKLKILAQIVESLETDVLLSVKKVGIVWVVVGDAVVPNITIEFKD
jgi:hypothetical protein